jgi:hypothetical protein
MDRMKVCLALLFIAPQMSVSQILGFIPPTDSLFLTGAGCVGPGVFATIDSTNPVIDSIHIDGPFNVEHFNVHTFFADSTFRPRVSFIVQDSAHDSNYQLWMELDTPYAPYYSYRTDIRFDEYSFFFSGRSRLALLVSRNGIPVDSMKIALLVQFLVSVGKSDQQGPMAAALRQNFPNPFNPSTSIAYAVGGIRNQESGFGAVRLVVYDLLGREVAVLVDERKAPGSYSVTFDGSKLASGVYVYRLIAGPYVESRKMVLVR